MDPTMYGALVPWIQQQMESGQPQAAGPTAPDYNAILGKIVQAHQAEVAAQQKEGAKAVQALQQHLAQQAMQAMGQQVQGQGQGAVGAQPQAPMAFAPQPAQMPAQQMPPPQQPMMRPPTPPSQPANQAMLPMHAQRYTGGPGAY